jgi:OmpA-OmpF porin, OOP family
MRQHVERYSGAIGVGVLLLSCTAWAQAGFDGQRYRPAAGAAGGFVVERAVVARHLGFGLGLIANYSDDPVVERDGLGNILSRPLDQALTLNLLASLGLGNWFELAADLPLHAIYTGDPVGALAASPGIGDLRLVPKAAWTMRGGVNFAIGAAVPVTLPTGNPGALRGNGSVTVHPELLLGLRGSGWGASANAGFLLRPGGAASNTLGNEVSYAAGMQFALWPKKDVLDLIFEGHGAMYLDARPQLINLPIEALVGLGIKPHPDWTIELGGGVGITRGVGDPRWRAIAGIRYTPNPASDYKDSDNDGVSDHVDQCPRQDEDEDGFEDQDGCPERDNDRDGVPDDRDECPDDPEGRVGDGDGCPEGEAYYERGRIYIKGKVQFETGSSKLKAKSEKLLDRVAVILKENPDIRRLRIEGHTDEVGPARSNQELSEDRADSVKRGLIRRGIAAGRLSSIGYGERRPIAPNKTAGGRAKNRRVEFVVH